MVRLRTERARLLGCESFAHFRLADTMAKTPYAGHFLDMLFHSVGRPTLLALMSSGRYLRPKNRGPDQRAPVISRATRERER